MTCLRSGDPAGSLHRLLPVVAGHKVPVEAHKLNWPRSLMLVLNKIFHRSGPPPQHVGRRAMDQAEQGDPQLRIPRLHGWVA